MRLFLLVLFLCVAGMVGWHFWSEAHPDAVEYKKQKLKKGNVAETVAVTGSAEPRDSWYENGQVANGIIAAVLVDYNEMVNVGQVLIRLNSELQKTQLDTAKRNFDLAKGQIAMASAKIVETQILIDQAKASLASAKKAQSDLLEPKVASVTPDVEKERIKYMVEQAEFGVRSAEAKKVEAETAKKIAELDTKRAEGQVEAAQLALDKTEIRSSRKGVVINRNVKVGEILGRPNISLMDAPSGGLFELAESLDRMRAIVKVNEADLSRVQVGQSATFKVDAYRDEVFGAKVVQIRNSPTNDRTAVTYPCILEFLNKKDAKGEWMIRPRLTVSVDILIQEKKNVLLVPNAALLYVPSNFKEAIPQVNSEKGERLVWVVGPNSKPTAKVITAGITDGNFTEVVKSELKENDEVILSEPPPAPKGFKMPSLN